MTWDNSVVTPTEPALFDRFGRKHDYLRVSLTDRCNFRCLYCMPEEGIVWQPREEILGFEEIERLVGLMVGMGIRKVRMTGGEPTLRKDYLDLVTRLSGISQLEKLALTTNGFRLAQDSPALKRAGLKSINISLDSLQRDRFERITRRDELERVLAGIEAALEAGLPTKVNVVLLPGINDDEVFDFVEFVRHRTLTVRFIEFMPFLNNGWSPSQVISSEAVRKIIQTKHAMKALPWEPDDVARDYEIEGFRGTIGFVSSVTESFCSGCSRMRLSADGQLKSCLFLPATVSLRDLLRSGASDDELRLAVQRCLDGKWKEHPSMMQWVQRDNKTMVQIGG